jgi:hypothetical protein
MIQVGNSSKLDVKRYMFSIKENELLSKKATEVKTQMDTQSFN